MPARLAALGDDRVDSVLFEPARLGDGGGGREGQRAGRFDARKQLGGRQAEMKADDRRPRLFNHRAQGCVEGRTDRRGGNSGWIDANLGIVGRSRFRQRASISGSDMGSAWQKKFTLKGASVACLRAAICSRRRSGVNIAAGSEPNPPALQTAIASSGPCAPAIGA